MSEILDKILFKLEQERMECYKRTNDSEETIIERIYRCGRMRGYESAMDIVKECNGLALMRDYEQKADETLSEWEERLLDTFLGEE